MAYLLSYSSLDPITTPGAMIEVKPNHHFRYRSMIQSITEGNPSDPNAVLGFYNWFNNPSGTSMQIKDGVVWHNEAAYFSSHGGEAHFGVSYSGARAYTKWSGNAADGTLVTMPGFTSRSSAGYENFYWIVTQAIYHPAAPSPRGIDFGATLVYGPADKGVLSYNRQFVSTLEFNGLIARRPHDSINFSSDYLGIRGPLQTQIFKSETVYELNYSFHVNRWLQWMPDLQLHEPPGGNPKNGIGLIVGFRSLIVL